MDRTVRYLGCMMLLAAMLTNMVVPGRCAELPETTPAEEQTIPQTMPTEEETNPQTAPTEETTSQTDPAEETVPETLREAETMPKTRLRSVPDSFPEGQWQLYFGMLHAHTDLSDGQGSVEEAFSHAAQVEGLDFFAVTDHSNSFDNADSGAIDRDGSAVSEEWARGKAAAASVTDEDFVGLFGYEMTWRDDRLLGHINTFNTPGWISRNQEGFNSLTAYYEALTTVPGSVSQFNHPGPETGDFENFGRWAENYDEAMALLEVGSGKGITAGAWYTRALDKGWHVAPTVSQNNHSGSWGDGDSTRTVILAQRLTEQSLFEAMAARRVYATEDSNLEVWYELDGQIMGSTVAAEENHTVSLWLRDPDEEDCQVEVITAGGAVSSSVSSDDTMPLTISVEGGKDYYYLRITQSDGDVAVTAPVWTVGYGSTGISSFAADQEVPVAGEPVTLTLTVRNDMVKPLTLQAAVYAEDDCIFSSDEPVVLAAGETQDIQVSHLRETPGQARFFVVVSGTDGMTEKNWEAELTLSYREKQMVGGMLLDGSHGQVPKVENLRTLTEKADMALTVFDGALPDGGEILVIPPPEESLEEEFVEKAAQFVRNGGLLILCGSSNETAAREQNRILEAAGFTARFRPDTAVDTVRFGEDSRSLHTTAYNRYTSLCRGITREQFYSHLDGCTVDPGEGLWLVKGETTTRSSETQQAEPVLLALEELPGGGRVLLAGSCFFGDEAMPLPDNVWDPPRVNQTLLQTLLGCPEERMESDSIAAVRAGTPGTLYRVAGYATSGTSNPHNVFPDTVYLQDDTGGIALIPFTDTGIQTGTPLEVVGALEERNGKPVLNPVRYRIPDTAACNTSPIPLNNDLAMDYSLYGDSLVQVEATVQAVTLTEDGKGVSRFTLVDSRGDRTVVRIEASITSGKFGVNNLAKKVKIGRTVRAVGIVDQDEEGYSYLRVRNCDEVVHVPPPKLYNPFTGDPIFGAAGTCLLSLGLLILLYKRKRV